MYRKNWIWASLVVSVIIASLIWFFWPQEAKRQEISSQYFNVNGVPFEMMKVEGGTFTMGATPEMIDKNTLNKSIPESSYDREKPAHKVTLSTFYIGKTEVTQYLWTSVMGYNHSKNKGELKPVENVSWNECQKFISKLNKITGQNFRLPTEAEWEFAARGGNNTLKFQYSGSNNPYDVAWYGDLMEGTTHMVGGKHQNELGICDMSGNVSEWCYDYYGGYSKDAQTNPNGPANGSARVVRGGSYALNAWEQRLSNRSCLSPDTELFTIGLRLAYSE